MADPTLSGPDRPGRRANGLQAAAWGALVDLDPRLSEGLLDRLAAAGVAAYVEPAVATDTVHRAVTMPVRPLDRLWVDPARAESARQVVASEVADLTALLAEDDPGATAHGLVHPVPRSAAPRVLQPPALPGPPARRPLPAPGTDLPGTDLPGTDLPRTDLPRPDLPRPDLPRPDLPRPDLPRPDLPGAGDRPASDDRPGAADRPSAAEQPGPGDPPPGDRPAPAGPTGPAEGRPDLPGPATRHPAPSDDEVFAQLVAQFHRDPEAGAPRTWPAAEDLSSAPHRRRNDPPSPPARRPAWLDAPPRPPGPAARGTTPGAPGTPSPTGPPAAGGGTSRPGAEPRAVPPSAAGGADDPDDPDDHYVPPPPPPVPRLRPRTIAAALSVVLGLLVLFAPALLRLPGTTGVGLIGIALLGGGAAALVSSVRDSSDSGPDDGAVV